MGNDAKSDGINYIYSEYAYNWAQVRDCVKGSTTVKIRQELYLPMPSGMEFLNDSPNRQDSISSRASPSSKSSRFFSIPWYHQNKAYQSYIQRARFPDITASSLRAFTGVATSKLPTIELPTQMEYLLDIATNDGMSLVELFAFCISEVLQVGKVVLVVDVKDDGQFCLVVYCAESNIDWKQEIIFGRKVQTSAVFDEVEYYTESDDAYDRIEYKLVLADDILSDEEISENVNISGELITVVVRDSGADSGPITAIPKYQGSPFKTLPVFNIGSIANTPEPDTSPLMGISDIAISIYRKDADLSHAQFLTCNPTLFLFGVPDDEVPKAIGSGIAVSVSNSDARAEYPDTDTTALEHMRECISDLMSEAVQYGANILAPDSRAAESAEALSIREASSGATLVNVVKMVAKGIKDALKFIAEVSGLNPDQVVFDPSIDFAEHKLSPQELTSLVASWMQGAISHDTLLDNLRDSSIVRDDIDNDKERERIASNRENIGLL